MKKKLHSHCVCIYFILISLVGFSFCSGWTAKDKTLASSKESGDSNSKELQEVLDYYKQKSDNPLKYKAASYLISNMQSRYSKRLAGKIPAIIKSSFSFLDSLIKQTYFLQKDSTLFNLTEYLNTQLDNNDFKPTPAIIDSFVNWKFGKTSKIQKSKIKTIEFWRISDSVRDALIQNIKTVQSDDGPVMDTTMIKSKWLIRHIENAFQMWRISPYAKNMKFDEFAQTLLSYRTFDEGIDVDFPSDLLAKMFSSVIRLSDISIANIVRNLNLYIYAADCFEDQGKNLGYLGFYDVLQFYKFDCDRHSEWAVKILNACGIPAYVDFTTGFFIRNKMHFGVSVRDVDGKYHHFTPKWQQIDDTAHSRLFSKVFRITFDTQNDCPFILKQRNEDLPPQLADAHMKDVTGNFHKVSTITVPCDSLPINVNIGYLATFTPQGWRPVGWGTINRKSKSLLFQQVPNKAMFIAGFYLDHVLIPTSQPFFVNSFGQVSYIKPDYGLTQTLHLTRKYPKKTNLVGFMKEMINTVIEAANKPDFSDAVVIHHVKATDLEDFGVKAINLFTTHKFQYLRLRPSKKKMLNIALIEIFSGVRKNEKYEEGATNPSIFNYSDTAMGRTSELKKIPFRFFPSDQILTAAIDQSMETYVCVPELKIDLLKPQEIRQIRIAPRNDNNGVVVGNEYKLYYYDRRWKEQSSQIAKYNFLDFPKIPAGTIYWLQNISGGKEELPFTYRENKESFVNNDEFEVNINSIQ